jgi:hypothetical protein
MLREEHISFFTGVHDQSCVPSFTNDPYRQLKRNSVIQIGTSSTQFNFIYILWFKLQEQEIRWCWGEQVNLDRLDLDSFEKQIPWTEKHTPPEMNCIILENTAVHKGGNFQDRNWNIILFQRSIGQKGLTLLNNLQKMGEYPCCISVYYGCVIRHTKIIPLIFKHHE